MTDSDIQKLKAIRAKCEELLEIAAKRTPGEWCNDPLEVQCIGDISTTDATPVAQAQSRQPLRAGKPDEERIANATFIAACAGAAEAGWRATIAAIDSLPTIVRQAERIKRIRWGYDGDCGADGLACDCEDFANDAIKSILTAWEGLV